MLCHSVRFRKVQQWHVPGKEFKSGKAEGEQSPVSLAF